MNIIDFEYDGQLASSFDLLFCQVDGDDGVTTLPNGCEINFNQVSTKGGSLWLTTNTTYDAVLETTFQMCKFNCRDGITAFDSDEQRTIVRWLNRKEPHVLRIISTDDIYDCCFFEGSFNLQKIETPDGVIGFELHFISNRPYAIGETIKQVINLTAAKEYKLLDVSDEVGYIYPNLSVTCLQDGDLRLYNALENRTTVIKNCTQNEKISFDQFLRFSSTNSNHKIQTDFNFIFFRIANSYQEKTNKISSSIDCKLELSYNPIIKGVGL